jgi:hypothetical protein
MGGEPGAGGGPGGDPGPEPAPASSRPAAGRVRHARRPGRRDAGRAGSVRAAGGGGRRGVRAAAPLPRPDRQRARRPGPGVGADRVLGGRRQAGRDPRDDPARRHPFPGSDHGDLPETWSQSLRYELAASLVCSAQSADTTAWLAWEQQARLPGTAERLEDGTLTAAKARAITETCCDLTEPVPPLRLALAGVPGLPVHGADHPVRGDLAGDPPPPARPVRALGRLRRPAPRPAPAAPARPPPRDHAAAIPGRPVPPAPPARRSPGR